MVLFLTLLVAGVTLVVIGATIDGVLYLMSVGVLLLVAALVCLAARSIRRSPRHTAR